MPDRPAPGPASTGEKDTVLILAAAYGNVANAELDYEAIKARAADEGPPAPADAKMLKTLKAAGIEAGKDFGIAAARRRTAKGLQCSMGTFRIPQKALKKLKTENGWIVIPDNFAAYGTDYKTRAGIALIGLGGIWRQDVPYPTAFLDGDGKPLDGANRYVPRFEAGQTPPTNVTWSVSMYDPRGYASAGRQPRVPRGRETDDAGNG